MLTEVRERGGETGFDALKGEYTDLLKSGVVDAAKVVRCAIQNAASVTSALLTSRTIIVELKEKKRAVAGALK